MTAIGQTKSTSTKEEYIESIDALFLKKPDIIHNNIGISIYREILIFFVNSILFESNFYILDINIFKLYVFFLTY